MIKKYLGYVLVLTGFGLFLTGPSSVLADEDSILLEDRTTEISEPIIPASDLVVSPEVQERIDIYTQEDASNLDIINELIENCKTSGIISSEEMNEMLLEFINSATIDPEILELATAEAAELIVPQTEVPGSPKTRALVVDPFATAKAGWAAGIQAVKLAGYTNTAMYMAHAQVSSPKSPNPSKHVSNNNAWAKSVVRDSKLLIKADPDFKKFKNSNLKTKTYSGTFSFNSGDKYYALHSVNYSYTYIKQSNGHIVTTGIVTDVYDFAWSNYKSIPTGIANNYAKGMQTAGLIKPYNIEIRCTF